MPTAPTFPGVYVEEVPSGVRPITGVATSIAAFIGYFSRGPMNRAVRVFNRSDFVRELGGLIADSEAAYALDQFFLNGGTQAWVVRTAGGSPAAATVVLQDGTEGVLKAVAASAGAWGNQLRIDVDYGTTDSATSFNLTVTELDERGAATRSEVFRNLTLAAGPRHVADVIANESRLVDVEVLNESAGRPKPTGTASDVHFALPDVSASDLTLTLVRSGDPEDSVTTAALPSPVPTTLAALASAVERLVRQAATAEEPWAKDVTVRVAGSLATGAQLILKSSALESHETLIPSGTLAAALGLTGTPNHFNVQQYALGSASNNAAQGAGVAGDDGGLPDGAALIDALAALDRVETFNLLALPDTVRLPDDEAAAVMAEAIAYCEKRRAFYLLDVPHDDVRRDRPEEVEAWLGGTGQVRHGNAALYYPRPAIADPLNEFRLRSVAPSGTVAGLYARTDAARGVWKAPAGVEATLAGVQALEYPLNDDENGVLNPLAINCLRGIAPFGNVAWGARTLVGSDQMASEWKYVPVRRLALFLEESLQRGLQFAVFEPNDEPLWAQIRLNVGAFLQNLFRQGAFQGQTPREAYFVRCDRETNTDDDVNRGIVNVVVGFAPLKPAEFVVLKIQQLAGQTQA